MILHTYNSRTQYSEVKRSEGTGRKIMGLKPLWVTKREPSGVGIGKEVDDLWFIGVIP